MGNVAQTQAAFAFVLPPSLPSVRFPIRFPSHMFSAAFSGRISGYPSPCPTQTQHTKWLLIVSAVPIKVSAGCV